MAFPCGWWEMSGWTADAKARVFELVKEGLPASQIAISLGVTRNAVIGVVHRAKDGTRLKGREVRPLPGRPKKNQPAKPRLVKQSRIPGILAGPKPKPHPGNIVAKKEARAFDPGKAQPVRTSPTAFECRAVPLVQNNRRDCWWPVNDAAEGEQHLFCGNPAEPGSSYCRAHFLRSIGSGTEAERTALRVARKAAAA